MPKRQISLGEDRPFLQPPRVRISNRGLQQFMRCSEIARHGDGVGLVRRADDDAEADIMLPGPSISLNESRGRLPQVAHQQTCNAVVDLREDAVDVDLRWQVRACIAEASSGCERVSPAMEMCH